MRTINKRSPAHCRLGQYLQTDVPWEGAAAPLRHVTGHWAAELRGLTDVKQGKGVEKKGGWSY